MISLAFEKACQTQAAETCTRSLMDRTEASDAFNAGSIPVECTGRESCSRLFFVQFSLVFNIKRALIVFYHNTT